MLHTAFHFALLSLCSCSQECTQDTIPTFEFMICQEFMLRFPVLHSTDITIEFDRSFWILTSPFWDMSSRKKDQLVFKHQPVTSH